MKNRSLVLTVSLIAMMIVGVAHGAQIASTDYVTKSVGDEADLVWTAIDSINNETTGILATAKSYTDGEITSAMEEVTDAIPTNNNQLTNGAGYITSAALPTKVSQLTNDTGFITSADIPDAPTVDDALSSTSTNAVQNKVVTAALASKADASAIPTDNAELANGAGYITAAALPTKVSQLTNDTGFITSADIPDAPTVDDALSSTSTNAVQNKVVTAALNGKMDKVTLATVATSGNYSDLSGRPTIPTNNNQLTNGAGYITAASLPGAATASAAGIMKWGQIPSGSATATTSATIWVQ